MTDALTVDLSRLPDGWFLYGLHHQHTPIKRRYEKHVPFDVKGIGFPWVAKLQHVNGGRLSEGQGGTPAEAIEQAIGVARLFHPDMVGGV